MPRPGPSSDLSQSLLERARPYLVTALLPFIILAAGSLVLEYGFNVRPEGLDVLHWIEWVALGGMLADPLVRLALARHRLALVRFRWFEFALAGAFLVYVGVVHWLDVPGQNAWLLRGVHGAIILGIVSRLVELHQHLAMKRVRPAVLIVGSFLTLIAIGTGLLLLPAATAEGQPPTTLTDAIFTATSAVCVTGLIVADTGTHWSRFGQYVILMLIQLGGLGLMTYASVFALFMWRGMRIREVLVLREAFTHDLRAEIGRLTTFILLTTLAVEAAGALLLFGLWDHTAAEAVVPLGERIFYSVFHSISAFCNAGFCMYADSLIPYRDTWQVTLVFPLLIISGGIGFAVLYNLARLVRYRLLSRKQVPLAKRRLTLQAKLAIAATVVLLVGGTGLALVLETAPGREDAWRRTAAGPDDPTGPDVADASPLGRSWLRRASGAWFLATTARTAGFNTSDTTHLAGPTKFLTVALMFIGASPGSTGGGIKTVTVVVVLCGVWATLRGRGSVQAFQRQIPPETVRRALAILAVGVGWVALTSMALAAWGIRDGAEYTFLDALFETQSAFATVGLSTGMTPLLNTFGRLLLAGTMFVGRIGLLTLFVAMQFKTQPQRYEYAKEYVAIS
ncbi:MAG: potassium transporter TrkG [Phycisphaerae bacterium]